jgi:hypothetical protein
MINFDSIPVRGRTCYVRRFLGILFATAVVLTAVSEVRPAYANEFNTPEGKALLERCAQNDFDSCRTAAFYGNADAQNNLGRMYVSGTNVKANLSEAFRWHLAAAKQGVVNSQFHVGISYLGGTGTETDYAQALFWLKPLSEHGDLRAIFFIGRMYEEGKGLPQDEDESIKWYRYAAEKGFADAQYAMGKSYVEGRGVDKNYSEAIKWYKLAADQGKNNALDEIKRLEHPRLESLLSNQNQKFESHDVTHSGKTSRVTDDTSYLIACILDISIIGAIIGAIIYFFGIRGRNKHKSENALAVNNVNTINRDFKYSDSMESDDENILQDEYTGSRKRNAVKVFYNKNGIVVSETILRMQAGDFPIRNISSVRVTIIKNPLFLIVGSVFFAFVLYASSLEMCLVWLFGAVISLWLYFYTKIENLVIGAGGIIQTVVTQRLAENGGDLHIVKEAIGNAIMHFQNKGG